MSGERERVRLWKPYRAYQHRGPFHDKDWRAKARRLWEGWMPYPVHDLYVRWRMARRTGKHLRDVPKPFSLLHPVWFTERDMARAEEVAAALERGEKPPPQTQVKFASTREGME